MRITYPPTSAICWSPSFTTSIIRRLSLAWTSDMVPASARGGLFAPRLEARDVVTLKPCSLILDLSRNHPTVWQ